MARPTRSERRARREARERSQQAAGNGGSGVMPPVALAPQPPEPAGPRRTTFVQESWAELKKVEWPGQSQVIQGVVVVMIAMIVIGFYLYVCDEVFRRLVENVFL